ncbi:2-aminomuconate deaminase [Burkholderia sp. WAC0059]|uniref:RidA family protein n=1 Tax=Burkholderia sp. WAC0059 TaxID=2066022 RepID=UPI000C7F50DF|nr:RidA family protein [Burkholderia sp. WAC0059]PLZ00592.1 2-aminomuconate deaminase [Burkholderia sp. WAC0059]
MNPDTANVRPLGNYPAAKVMGDLVFVSGLSARLPGGAVAGASVVDGRLCLDVAVQTRTIFDKLQAVLREYGTGIEHCLDITVFLVDMGDFDAFNQVYSEYFPMETGPARTTVAVRALPRPEMVVEFKVMAARPHEARGSSLPGSSP